MASHSQIHHQEIANALQDGVSSQKTNALACIMYFSGHG